jgi:diacylglycerol O-acyltransferase
VPVAEVIALPLATGNATVVSGGLSYAGSLRVTVVADPDRWPELQLLTAGLQHELDQLAGESLPLAP